MLADFRPQTDPMVRDPGNIRQARTCARGTRGTDKESERGRPPHFFSVAGSVFEFESRLDFAKPDGVPVFEELFVDLVAIDPGVIRAAVVGQFEPLVLDSNPRVPLGNRRVGYNDMVGGGRPNIGHRLFDIKDSIVQIFVPIRIGDYELPVMR